MPCLAFFFFYANRSQAKGTKRRLNKKARRVATPKKAIRRRIPKKNLDLQSSACTQEDADQVPRGGEGNTSKHSRNVLVTNFRKLKTQKDHPIKGATLMFIHHFFFFFHVKEYSQITAALKSVMWTKNLFIWSAALKSVMWTKSLFIWSVMFPSMT